MYYSYIKFNFSYKSSLFTPRPQYNFGSEQTMSSFKINTKSTVKHYAGIADSALSDAMFDWWLS